jgi:phage-related protein
LEFLEELERFEPKNYAKWLYEKTLIQEHGTDIGPPHWKRLGDGLGEIRWRVGNVQMRIYASEERERSIVMLHGTRKKWWSFDNADKKNCEDRRQDFRSGAYDQKTRELLRKKKNNA